MYTDVLCEDSNIDLLNIINIEQDISAYYNDIIAETDLLNSIYEDQKFIKEADDTLLLSGPTKYDDRSKLKKISDKVVQTIKDLIQRFLKRLKQFKNFLVELTKKKEKKEKNNYDYRDIYERVKSNPDIKVPIVYINNFNVNSVIDSNKALKLLDAIDECISVIKDNRGKELDPKNFKEKVTKIKKISNDYSMENNSFSYVYDLNALLHEICSDIGIGIAYDSKTDKFDITKCIKYSQEECLVLEYYHKYYNFIENEKKNIEKSLMIKSKKNDELYKRIEKIENEASNISNMDPNAKYLKTIAPFVSVLYRAASYEQICIAHLTKALQVHDSNVNKILSIKTNNKRK